MPGNQLLESDVVYIRDPLKVSELNDLQLRKLCVLAHHSMKSPDLCVYFLLELERRDLVEQNSADVYFEFLANNADRSSTL